MSGVGLRATQADVSVLVLFNGRVRQCREVQAHQSLHPVKIAISRTRTLDHRIGLPGSVASTLISSHVFPAQDDQLVVRLELMTVRGRISQVRGEANGRHAAKQLDEL